MPNLFRLAVSSILLPEPEPRCVEAIREAGARGADLVLLPEEPDIAAQKPPGEFSLQEHPLFLAYQQACKQANIGVVGSLSAKVGDGFANTGFVIDRDGSLVGTYFKKHPAPSEEAIFTTEPSGDPFPVFDFEGVKIGIAICMDIHFPEMFRIYGLKGADLVCIPTMYLDYTGDMLESIEKARAIDSQMYVAVSRYFDKPFLAGKNMGYAKVIAPDGRVIASTGHQEGLSIAEFDPKWRMLFWNEGYEKTLREMFDGRRRPDLYGCLTEPKTPSLSEGEVRGQSLIPSP